MVGQYSRARKFHSPLNDFNEGANLTPAAGGTANDKQKFSAGGADFGRTRTGADPPGAERNERAGGRTGWCRRSIGNTADDAVIPDAQAGNPCGQVQQIAA